MREKRESLLCIYIDTFYINKILINTDIKRPLSHVGYALLVKVQISFFIADQKGEKSIRFDKFE